MSNLLVSESPASSDVHLDGPSNFLSLNGFVMHDCPHEFAADDALIARPEELDEQSSVDLFTQHFRDLQEGLPSIDAMADSTQPQSPRLAFYELLLNFWARELPCRRMGDDKLHDRAMAGLSVFTEEEKVSLILRLDLTVGMLRREAAKLKDGVKAEARLAQEKTEELNELKEGLERARDMFESETARLGEDRITLEFEQAAFDLDVNRFGKYLSLGETIEELKQSQIAESALVAHMRNLLNYQYHVGNFQLQAIANAGVPPVIRQTLEESHSLIKKISEDTKAFTQFSEHLKSVTEALDAEKEKHRDAAFQKLQLENDQIRKQVEVLTQALSNAQAEKATVARPSLCILM